MPNAVSDLFFGVAGPKTRRNEGESSENCDGGSELYVAYDNLRTCSSCSATLQCSEDGRNCAIEKRQVSIHSLLHGTIQAVVLDLVCEECKEMVTFDGRDAG